jgi:hypothetical protein
MGVEVGYLAFVSTQMSFDKIWHVGLRQNKIDISSGYYLCRKQSKISTVPWNF